MYFYEGGGVIFSSLIKMLVRLFLILVFNKSYFGYLFLYVIFMVIFILVLEYFLYFVIFIMFIV